MTTKAKNSLSDFFPKSIHRLLQKRPLVVGEDPADFDALLLATAAAIEPQDAIECILVKDIVSLIWEIERYRSYAAKILSNDIPEALAALLQRHPDLSGRTGDERSQEARRLAQAYCAGDADARRAVAKYLADIGLDEDSAPAFAFSRKIGEAEAAMRLAATSEARRENLLRELERYRSSRGRRIREIVDGDFVEAPKLAMLEAADPQPPTPATKRADEPA
jgi:hypothetical protein